MKVGRLKQPQIGNCWLGGVNGTRRKEGGAPGKGPDEKGLIPKKNAHIKSNWEKGKKLTSGLSPKKKKERVSPRVQKNFEKKGLNKKRAKIREREGGVNLVGERPKGDGGGGNTARGVKVKG